MLDNVFSSIDNIQGKFIKFVLGSRVMTEGITIKQIKEIHILDTAYHLGQLMQVIGRGIRFCVHNSLATEENPYPEVKVYRYVVSMLDKQDELSTECILYQKAEKKYLLVTPMLTGDINYLRLKNKICLSPFISIACTPYLYSPNSEAVINQTKGLTIKNWTGILTTQIGLTFQIKEQKKDTTNKPIL